jgi:hypothetical protein
MPSDRRLNTLRHSQPPTPAWDAPAWDVGPRHTLRHLFSPALDLQGRLPLT